MELAALLQGSKNILAKRWNYKSFQWLAVRFIFCWSTNQHNMVIGSSNNHNTVHT